MIELPYITSKHATSARISAVKLQKSCHFCLQCWVFHPFLLQPAKNFSPSLLKKLFVGVFIYAESAQTLPFTSTTHFQKSTDVPRHLKNSQTVKNSWRTSLTKNVALWPGQICGQSNAGYQRFCSYFFLWKVDFGNFPHETLAMRTVWQYGSLECVLSLPLGSPPCWTCLKHLLGTPQGAFLSDTQITSTGW